MSDEIMNPQITGDVLNCELAEFKTNVDYLVDCINKSITPAYLDSFVSIVHEFQKCIPSIIDALEVITKCLDNFMASFSDLSESLTHACEAIVEAFSNLPPIDFESNHQDLKSQEIYADIVLPIKTQEKSKKETIITKIKNLSLPEKITLFICLVEGTISVYSSLSAISPPSKQALALESLARNTTTIVEYLPIVSKKLDTIESNQYQIIELEKNRTSEITD